MIAAFRYVGDIRSMVDESTSSCKLGSFTILYESSGSLLMNGTS